MDGKAFYNNFKSFKSCFQIVITFGIHSLSLLLLLSFAIFFCVVVVAIIIDIVFLSSVFFSFHFTQRM